MPTASWESILVRAYRWNGSVNLTVHSQLRFLLLQVRDPDDVMIWQEIGCFARALECRRDQIEAGDLLAAPPSESQLRKFDCVLIGGSGAYSATGEGEWLDRTLDLLRDLVVTSKPTFASCWGFQAMARALGGNVVTDLQRAELGTIRLHRTEAGGRDPVFGELPSEFCAQLGHEDIVTQLPREAICLARSERVENEAFVIRDRPIYATQFHPELDVRALLQRVEVYPEYVAKIAGMTLDEFKSCCQETPEARTLLRRFVTLVFA